MASELNALAPPNLMRLLHFMPHPARCTLLDLDAELQETVAVRIAMDFVQQARCILAAGGSVPSADRYNLSGDSNLPRYLTRVRAVPSQLMESDGAPLRQLLADASRDAPQKETPDGTLVLPCVHIPDLAAWVADLLLPEFSDRRANCCALIPTVDGAPKLRIITAANGTELACTQAATVGHALCLAVLLRDAIVDERWLDKMVHNAAGAGHAECLRMLHEAGANLTAVSTNGVTPTHAAASRGYIACIQLLHELGADVQRGDFRGRNPEMYASDAGHMDCVRLFERWRAEEHQALLQLPRWLASS